MNINEIRFDISKKDSKILSDILQRVRNTWSDIDTIDMEMDLTATHANGMPLDFQKLYGADFGNFAHDILGIRRHLNRETGKLMNHFVPRCAKG